MLSEVRSDHTLDFGPRLMLTVLLQEHRRHRARRRVASRQSVLLFPLWFAVIGFMSADSVSHLSQARGLYPMHTWCLYRMFHKTRWRLPKSKLVSLTLFYFIFYTDPTCNENVTSSHLLCRIILFYFLKLHYLFKACVQRCLLLIQFHLLWMSDFISNKGV